MTNRKKKRLKKKLIGFILALVLLSSSIMPLFVYGLLFEDVLPYQYYYNPVNWAVENNIAYGTSSRTFSPNEYCSRAQIVTFLWRLADCPTPIIDECPFVDVQTDKYYYVPVMWASQIGLIFGTDATHFNPDDYVTREQYITILYRFAGNPRTNEESCNFIDVNTALYYYYAVCWACDNSITNGIDTNLFGVGYYCKRGEAVTFLYRLKDIKNLIVITSSPKVDTLTTLQRINLKDSLVNTFTYYVKSYKGITDTYINGTAEQSKPRTVTITFKNIGSIDTDATQYILISSDPDFDEARRIETNNFAAQVNNLLPGQKYYAKVETISGNRVYYSMRQVIETSSSKIINYNVDGVTNCRDMGGKVMANGNVMKTGLLIRTGSLDNITEEGKKTLLYDLGIKTDMELRAENESGVSPLGESVYFAYCGMIDNGIINQNYEGEINRLGLRQAFHVMADENNYPIDFHCYIGTDRTGYLAICLLGLAGVSMNDIRSDYLFSNYGQIGGQRTIDHFNGVLNMIFATCDSNCSTFSEKVYSHLLNMGVNQEDLDKTIAIITQ